MPEKIYIVYNMPEIMKMFNLGYSFEKISKSLSCVSRTCSKVNIYNIINDVVSGKIDPTKTGILKDIKAKPKKYVPVKEVEFNFVPHFYNKLRTLLSEALNRNPDIYENLKIIRKNLSSLLKREYYKESKHIHPDINKQNPMANKEFIDFKKAYEKIKNECSNTKIIF